MIITPTTDEFSNYLPIFAGNQFVSRAQLQQTINNLREKTDFFNCAGDGLNPRVWGGNLIYNTSTRVLTINPGIFNDDKFFDPSTETIADYNIAKIACLHNEVLLNVPVLAGIYAIQITYTLIKNPMNEAMFPTVGFNIFALADLPPASSVLALFTNTLPTGDLLYLNNIIRDDIPAWTGRIYSYNTQTNTNLGNPLNQLVVPAMAGLNLREFPSNFIAISGNRVPDFKITISLLDFNSPYPGSTVYTIYNTGKNLLWIKCSYEPIVGSESESFYVQIPPKDSIRFRPSLAHYNNDDVPTLELIYV